MLEAFVRVAELGSFTRAASQLDIPRATTTELVKALEARVGTTLLHRTTRRVALTQEGAAFAVRAARILAELEDAEDELGVARGAVRGRLRVDVTASSGRHLIAPALPSFFARHPDVDLELGSGDRPVDLLDEGIDCVIRGGDLHDETLIAKKLIAYEVGTFAAPSYLLRHGTPTSPHALGEHRFVNFFSSKTGRTFDNDFISGDEHLELRGRQRIAVNDADVFLAAGLAGLGLLQLPLTSEIRAKLASGALVRVLTDWRVPPLPIFALWPRRRDRSPRVHAFVSWVAELYENEQASIAASEVSAGRRRSRKPRPTR